MALHVEDPLVDYTEEIEHWDALLARGEPPALDPRVRPGIFPVAVIPCVYEARDATGREARVLDVGSGPVSQLAWGLEQGLIALEAIDPLADAYAEMLARHGHAYPVRARQGMGEELLQHFPHASFDVVYCGNALDHVVSPRDCLESMHAVLAPGGFLVIASRLREGTNESWQGLHQHDLVPDEGRLLRFGKDGAQSELTAGLELDCLAQRMEGRAPGDTFWLIWRKPPAPVAAGPTRHLAYWMRKQTLTALARTDPARREAAFPPRLVRLAASPWRAQRGAGLRVLDAAAGPFSPLAFGVEQGFFDLLALDPLAPLIADLLARQGFTYPVRPLEGCGEEPAPSWRDGAFDLVFASEALEFAASPRRCLAGLAAALAPGGLLTLEGTARAATLNGFRAPRQHDIRQDGDRLLWSTEGQEQDLMDGLALAPFEDAAPSAGSAQTYAATYVRG